MYRFLFFNNTKSEYINHIYNLLNGIYHGCVLKDNVISFIDGDIDIVDVLNSYITDTFIKINVIVSEPWSEFDNDVKDILMSINESASNIVLEKEILRKCNQGIEVIKKHILKSYYESFEIEEIVLALANSNLNVSKAAEQLFMHRNTLMNKLDKFYKDTNYDLRSFNDLVIIYNLF